MGTDFHDYRTFAPFLIHVSICPTSGLLTLALLPDPIQKLLQQQKLSL